jgi:hypothetical protein
LAQSGAQHRPDCRREHCLISIRGDPGSKSFDDEKWIAFGLAPESCRQVLVNRVLSSQPRSERSRGGLIERVEWHGGHCLVVAQRVDESDEGIMLWDLFPADGTDDEDRCRLSGPDNETDQLDRLGVTPLQIVDDQQARAAAADNGSVHSIEQSMALSRLARLARSGWLRCVEEFGQEASELGPPDRVERVDVAPDSIRSE